MIKTHAGWAVLENGSININTVSETRRAAIVNWLIVHGTMVFHQTTDEQIEVMWHAKCGKAVCTTIEVNISPR